MNLAGVFLHGFGQRYDLPINFALYLYASAGVVVISFVMVAVFAGDRVGDLATRYPTRPAALLDALDRSPLSRRIGGLFGALALALVIIAGILGNQRPERNPAEYLVWIYFWVGLVIFCALFGNLWEYLNPFAALHGLLARWVAPAPHRLPDWLGIWPATVFFFAFEVLEQASGVSNRPLVIGALALLYTLFTVAGMLLFGRDAWLSRVEAFTVLFDLVSRFSPVERGEDGRLRLRPWGAGLLRPYPAGWDRVLLILALLSTLAFDGLSATQSWLNVANSTQRYFAWAGPLATPIQRTAAMVATTAVFWLAFTLVVALVMYFGYRRVDRMQTITLFALTVVPIGLVYNAAHYYSYFVVQSQSLIPLLADPLGQGPAPTFVPSFALANAELVWYVQVVLIVLGHVAAVYLAHLRAGERFRTAKNALLSQYPMLILMVGYTMTSLWILSQATTRGG